MPLVAFLHFAHPDTKCTRRKINMGQEGMYVQKKKKETIMCSASAKCRGVGEYVAVEGEGCYEETKVDSGTDAEGWLPCGQKHKVLQHE